MTPVCIVIKWILPSSYLTGSNPVCDNIFSNHNRSKTYHSIKQIMTVVKFRGSMAYEIDEALTSYFCLLSFSLRSNFSASSSIIHCHSSLAFSLRNQVTRSDIGKTFSKPDLRAERISRCARGRQRAMAHFNLSSDRWSMLSGFLLSAKIFFFFSLSVCFFAPLRPSICQEETSK